MSASSPGVELVLELVREAARGRRCVSCGSSLAEAHVEPDAVDVEHVAARLVCQCGAVEIVEVRPAGDGGRAEIR
ncbi:MAG: hypothetical protein ACRDLK_11325 [Gaiellaceae bacterium]